MGVGRSTSPPFPDGSELKNNAASHVGRNRHVTVSVSYTHLTLPTMSLVCRSRWSPDTLSLIHI